MIFSAMLLLTLLFTSASASCNGAQGVCHNFSKTGIDVCCPGTDVFFCNGVGSISVDSTSNICAYGTAEIKNMRSFNVHDG